MPMLALAHQRSRGRSTVVTKHCCVLLRVAAYILRILPKKKGYSSITGAIADPSELEKTQMKMFHVVQFESFPPEKKNLLKNSPLNSSAKILQFYPKAYFGQQVNERNSLLQVLTPNTQCYLIVIIQLHACSTKTYPELIVIRAWTI